MEQEPPGNRALDGIPFIFVIGFNKTASVSIHSFFKANGYPSVHWDRNRLAGVMLANVVSGRPPCKGYDRDYRVFSDMAYHGKDFWFEGNSLYHALDRAYPDAYFIYNKRPMDKWLASRSMHRSVRLNQPLMFMDFFKRILGTGDEDCVRDHWRRTRENYERDIRLYFERNPRFIELDIEDPAFPRNVARFLGREMDAAHWTQHNVTARRRVYANPSGDPP